MLISGQSFARKFIRPVGSDAYDEFINEARAILKLCGYGNHDNIIALLDWGKLGESPYYFFDMELCNFNLDDYIQGKEIPEFCQHDLKPSKAVKLPLEARLWNLWNIMEQVARGVEYIHMNNEVHRDLKPSNSTT
jgi:serine/threonine protein kinase